MYPRESGHCLSHHIPAKKVNLGNWNMEDNAEAYIQALEYLWRHNADLRKDDLVIFDSDAGYSNNGVAIFDGENIIDLYFEIDDYGSLPPKFRVIEGGVPLNYWAEIDDIPSGYGIAHNRIVWFNHRLVRDQCLANLTYGMFDEEYYCIFTFFNYRDITYNIIFIYTGLEGYDISNKDYFIAQLSDREEIMNTIRNSLQGDNLIVFDIDSDPYPTRDNTLYVALSQN